MMRPVFILALASCLASADVWTDTFSIDRIALPPGIDPQIGVIGLSMQMIIDRLATAYDKGIRMFQISLPSWGPLDLPEMLVFFSTVCGAFPDCRFLHYNLPRAGRIVAGSEYRRIIDEVPNLVATKNSSTDYARTADLMTHVPQLQHFFLEGNFAMGCTMGQCSLLCSYDVLFPKTTWKFFQAGLDGDLPELFRISKFLYDVGNTLFAHCRRDMIDGSFDKTFVWLKNPLHILFQWVPKIYMSCQCIDFLTSDENLPHNTPFHFCPILP